MNQYSDHNGKENNNRKLKWEQGHVRGPPLSLPLHHLSSWNEEKDLFFANP